MENDRTIRAAQVLSALGKALAYLALFLGCQFLVSAVASLTVLSAQMIASGGNLDLPQILSELTALTIPVTLISNLLTLVILALFFLLRRKPVLQEVCLCPTSGMTAAGAAALAPVLYAAVILVLSLVPAAWLADYAQASASLSQASWLSLLAVGLSAPVTEEVIFRGLIQSRLARALPGWLALVLSSALFALCHAHPLWMAYAFAMGLVLGRMAQCAGSILPSVIAHAGFNLIGQILSLPPLARQNSYLVLAVLILVGAAACLFTRKGVRALFLSSHINGKGD